MVWARFAHHCPRFVCPTHDKQILAAIRPLKILYSNLSGNPNQEYGFYNMVH